MFAFLAVFSSSVSFRHPMPKVSSDPAWAAAPSDTGRFLSPEPIAPAVASVPAPDVAVESDLAPDIGDWLAELKGRQGAANIINADQHLRDAWVAEETAVEWARARTVAEQAQVETAVKSEENRLAAASRFNIRRRVIVTEVCCLHKYDQRIKQCLSWLML